MDFEVHQRYPAPAADVMSVYADATFYESLGGGARIGAPQVLERVETDEGVVSLRIRYRFTADLPRGAGRFVQKDKLTWVEHTEYDLSALIARTTLTADEYDTLLTASATQTFRPDDDHSTRAVTGNVGIAVPFLGGKVERAIVEGLEEHLEEERQVVLRRLGT